MVREIAATFPRIALVAYCRAGVQDSADIRALAVAGVHDFIPHGRRQSNCASFGTRISATRVRRRASHVSTRAGSVRASASNGRSVPRATRGGSDGRSSVRGDGTASEDAVQPMPQGPMPSAGGAHLLVSAGAGRVHSWRHGPHGRIDCQRAGLRIGDGAPEHAQADTRGFEPAKIRHDGGSARVVAALAERIKGFRTELHVVQRSAGSPLATLPRMGKRTSVSAEHRSGVVDRRCYAQDSPRSRQRSCRYARVDAGARHRGIRLAARLATGGRSASRLRSIGE